MIEPRPEVASMTLYTPGMPLSEARRDSGRRKMVKLASNESLWGPSPKAVKAAGEALQSIQYYPLVQESEMLKALAGKYGLDPGQIVVGNGADEVLRLVAEAYLRPGDEVLFPAPSFSAYQHCALLGGALPRPVPLASDGSNDLDAMLARITSSTRLVYLCSPNNPTGPPVSAAAFEAYLSRVPRHVLTVVDSAYYEYCGAPQPDFAALVSSGKPVVWVRTFSKLYALASLRVGWAAADPAIVESLLKVRDPFSVNGVGWAAALASLEDQPYFARVLDQTRESRDYLIRELRSLGFFVYDSETNFVTFRIKTASNDAADQLRRAGFVVRPTESFGLSRHLRVTAAPLPIMREFIAAMASLGMV